MTRKGRVLPENKMALYNIASTVLVASINFITIPIFTRLLDTDGYGLVNVYVAWVQIFTVFIGLKADGSIGSASANLSEDEQDSYQFSVLVMSLAVFAAVFCIVLLFLHPISELLGMSQTLTVCMIIQSFGSFVIAFFNMRYIFRKQAQKNFMISAGVCLSTTLLSVVLIFVAFTGENGHLGRVYGLTIPYAFIGFGLFLSLALARDKKLNLSYWRFCLVLTVPLIFHGLSQILLSQTGKIMLQQVHGDSIAGIYSLAVVIVSLLNAIYSALNNAFVPFMYDDLAGKTSETVKQSHFSNYFVSFTLGTVAFAFISPELLKMMSTEAYWSAIHVLPFLVIGQYCVFLYSFPVNFEFYKMKTRSVALGTVLAAVLNIVLSVVLIPPYGMEGAALATMVSYAALFVFHFAITRLVLGDKNYPAKYYFFGLMIVTIASLLFFPAEEAVAMRWAVALVALALVGIRIFRTKSIF